jgi:hypothetical protein
MSEVLDSRDIWDGSYDGSAENEILEFDFVNFNLSCAARNIQGPLDLPHSSTFTTTMRAIQATFFAFNFFVGSFLNTLVIVLVAKYKKLQTHSLLLALQIVVLSLILALLSAVSFVNTIVRRWLFGEYMLP